MQNNYLTVAWFRQDLRLSDNPALHHAIQNGEILPIYILDDVNAQEHRMGGASRAWLYRSLLSLNAELDGKIKFFLGDASEIIPKLVDEAGAQQVVWNRCYEPWRVKRDTKIKTLLEERQIKVNSFNGSLIREPWHVLKLDDSPYKVFTPYYKAGYIKREVLAETISKPKKIEIANFTPKESVSLEQLDLSSTVGWDSSLFDFWQAGEKAASDKLNSFCTNVVSGYREGRDFPALLQTSFLSPHLHFGEISPRQIWQRVTSQQFESTSDDLQHFKREIVWREFSYYLLYHFPDLPSEPLNEKFRHFKWLTGQSENLKHWQKGQTGFPIVDAGMRELWQTGTMHNRVRMIVASFLVKNLLIHWKAGAAWFWHCLFDADLASNSASWQWVSGSGADAAPYFRIFNPVLQSEKFDPQTEYICRFCPELKALPTKYRHKPWETPESILEETTFQLGKDYPLPIVDLKTSRYRALAAHSKMKEAIQTLSA